MERTRKIVNTKRAITQKVDEPELRFMCSARRLMVFNVCVKFHENMSSGFKVMERTRKLLTDTHTHRKDENIIPPWYTLYAGGIKSSMEYKDGDQTNVGSWFVSNSDNQLLPVQYY